MRRGKIRAHMPRLVAYGQRITTKRAIEMGNKDNGHKSGKNRILTVFVILCILILGVLLFKDAIMDVLFEYLPSVEAGMPVME